jgi:NodT family efflux transporter outer membrane factor (OMF) lipoprotein
MTLIPTAGGAGARINYWDGPGRLPFRASRLSAPVAGFCAIITLLSGCAVGPDFVRPAPPATDHYSQGTQPAVTVVADGRAQNFTSGAATASDWWRLFQSPPLDAVVWMAITNSPTLQAAEASLRQSQDNLRAGYGVFFPHLQADAAGTRQRTSSAQQGALASGRIFSLVTLSGSVSYALDVFGGSRRTVESLRAQADYQRYESQAACLTLTANVVDTCIARAGYAAEIRAVQELIQLENEQLHLAEAQVGAGTVPYANVLSLRSLIAAQQASLAPLEQAVSESGNLLATLEGRVPAEAILPDLELAGLTLPADLPLSLPSELVRQRPDILSAEAQLQAASAKIGVATAAMYPSFSLSGTYGTAGSSFGNLSALTLASGQFWSIGPSATVPVFQGTSLWFGRRAAIGAYQQAQANYRETVLGAFAQVANSLKALVHDAQALQAQVEARDAAREALGLLQTSYQAGLTGYLEVLSADVQFHEASIAYLQAVAQRYQDTVALLVALGGGWWNGQNPLAKGGTP